MRLHPVRTAVLVIFGLILVAAVWSGWQAFKVSQNLRAAVEDANAVESAARAGDEVALDAAIESLSQHSGRAHDRTSGWTWSALTVLPVVGDDAQGVRTVSEVVSELSRDGLTDLASAARDLDEVVPSGGQISIDAVRSLQGPVDRGVVALETAGDRLEQEDPSGYVTRLREDYRELAGRVSDASRALRAAGTALEVMPSMLGDGEKREYLLVVQNNAEVRATGGIPGSLSLLEAQDGRLQLMRQASAVEFGKAPGSVLPLTPEERELYSPALGQFVLSANFTPDFPRTADLLRAQWERLYPERLDGVLSLDAVAASYILGATGPIEVDGVQLNQENVVDELLHQVYLRFENPADQDTFFRSTAKAMFDRVASGVSDPTALFQALARGAEERRLYVHSFNQTEQTELSGSIVTGEVSVKATDVPVVDVTLNDTTGSKMSYFLRSKVDVVSTSCQGGRQRFAGSADLSSLAPSDAGDLPSYVTGGGQFGIPAGDQLVTVRVFGPIGGSVDRMRLNYKRTEVNVVRQDDRDVATFYVNLEPGQTVSIDWQMETGPDQTGDARVRVTPGIEPKGYSATSDSSCR